MWETIFPGREQNQCPGEMDMDPGYSRRKITTLTSRLVIDGRKNWVLGAS
jgi:hypothetical protein